MSKLKDKIKKDPDLYHFIKRGTVVSKKKVCASVTGTQIRLQHWGYNLEFRSIFRSFETLEGMIDNFQAKKSLFTLETR